MIIYCSYLVVSAAHSQGGPPSPLPRNAGLSVQQDPGNWR